MFDSSACSFFIIMRIYCGIRPKFLYIYTATSCSLPASSYIDSRNIFFAAQTHNHPMAPLGTTKRFDHRRVAIALLPLPRVSQQRVIAVEMWQIVKWNFSILLSNIVAPYNIGFLAVCVCVFVCTRGVCVKTYWTALVTVCRLFDCYCCCCCHCCGCCCCCYFTPKIGLIFSEKFPCLTIYGNLWIVCVFFFWRNFFSARFLYCSILAFEAVLLFYRLKGVKQTITLVRFIMDYSPGCVCASVWFFICEVFSCFLQHFVFFLVVDA